MSCGVLHRRGSDPALLWLWCRQAATAPIRPLAWEPPYATGVALEKTKRPKKKKTQMLASHEISQPLPTGYLNPLSVGFRICTMGLVILPCQSQQVLI